ncbi:MAG: Hsp20/alpha crystallin family protein [Planctomycetota bacterium]|nr:Hsp20/alpha crystallin family protein [Planctomycetota bacterium]
MTKIELRGWEPTGLFPHTPIAFGHRFEDLMAPFTKEGMLVPPMDVKEDDEAYTLVTELPGLTKNEITIAFEAGVVRITGEKKQEAEEKKPNFHRLERRYGRFSREFRFEHPVDADKAEATFKRGILKIVLPKTEASKPKILKLK